MKKVKIQKSYFDTFKWTSGGSERNFFCANSKSKIVVSVDGAYASKDKMARIWPTLKKNYFLFQPSTPLPIETLHAIKIIKIEEMKNLTLGHL
jgi:hypothetical protein